MATFPWGSLIGAGGSLLGGLFGQSAQNKQMDYMKKYNKNKIQWTVADAQKAGIHPLAALGSPVAGSFAAPVGGSPMGDAVGDAAAQIGQGISRMESANRSREQDDLNKMLLRAQIRNVDAQTSRTLAEATSRTQIAKIRDGTRGNGVQIAGVNVKNAEGWSSAQDVEDEYGDIGGSVYGGARAARDALETLTDWMTRKPPTIDGAEIIRRNRQRRDKYRYQKVPDLGGHHSP